MDTKKKTALDYYGATTSDGNNTESETSVYDDALSKVQRDQNYKSFYNSAIQLYNMKNNAQKYLDNELASRGLNTQGYGSSAKTGINNNAINLYEQNLNNYNQTEGTITEDAVNRYNSKQEELDNQLVYFLQNDIDSGEEDKINVHLSNYGYMTYDEASDSYIPTEKWNNLDSDRKAYIQSIIDGGKTSTSTEGLGSVYTYTPDAKIPAYDNSGTSVGVQTGRFNNENDTLSGAMLTGEINKDTYIRLTNDQGNNVYLYYGTDGQLYYVTPETYTKNANANNSYYIESYDKKVYKGTKK